MRTILKTRREEMQLTQQKIAERIGITPAWYAIIEMGRKNPSTPVLLRMEEVLGLPPSEMMKNFPTESIPGERNKVNSD
ncbi:MAG: helix-turn-helix transcriptional regulator [Oscillospiraceae bacterium]|jgi:transcriptional regulator with XRE-family HTH domain|nr:helix-turn-helix transcriptional regulator [Oscillospiraceae bacterium]